MEDALPPKGTGNKVRMVRVRCEPELEHDLDAIAKAEHLKLPALVRKVLWDFAEGYWKSKKPDK